MNTDRPLVERIDHFLAERIVVEEHTRAVNKRMDRGEWVMLNSAPVASAEDGLALLKEASEALQKAAGVFDAAEGVLRAAGEGVIESYGLGSDAPLRVLRAALYGSVPMDEEGE